ncbi:MAG: glutamine-hydrolyzing GMP synthase [Acidobacteriota bacterium]
MEKIIILDFGSQYTQLIARKIRELGVYSEIHRYDLSLSKIKTENPRAIILSGGPSSVWEKDSPKISKEVFNLEIPVFGICYGLQLISHLLGGKVVKAKKREYGFAELFVKDFDGLFKDLPEKSQVWMSHGDEVYELPDEFKITASTENSRVAAIENRKKYIYGVQFHPEVVHTQQGKKILQNFIFNICHISPSWSIESFIEDSIKKIRNTVKQEKVLCALSGGVDSTVTAMLINKAVDKSLISIFVNTGFLRKGEFEYFLDTFRNLKLKVIGVDASRKFLEALRGIVNPEKKRKIIGKLFIDIFKDSAKNMGGIKFFAQGTTYPDVIESSSVKGPSAVIKSHHNVGGLPKNIGFKLLEPLKELFKDEVREIGRKLGIDEEIISRHPFPGPGLAVRIVGKITPERLRILREVDEILLEEIKKSNIYNNLWQAFSVLLPVRSVGVMGDQRTYQQAVVLRMVESIDGMTANWYRIDYPLLSKISSRIVNEVKGVNRVLYDITTKPPGTIEWE